MEQNEYQEQDSEQDHMLGPRRRMSFGAHGAEPRSVCRSEDTRQAVRFHGQRERTGRSQAMRIQAVLLLGRRQLLQREMLVHAACPGVRQPEGSSRRSISLIKSKRPCARLLY